MSEGPNPPSKTERETEREHEHERRSEATDSSGERSRTGPAPRTPHPERVAQWKADRPEMDHPNPYLETAWPILNPPTGSIVSGRRSVRYTNWAVQRVVRTLGGEAEAAFDQYCTTVGRGFVGLGFEPQLRTYLLRTWGFGVPHDEAIDRLVERSPVIEIGAGTGYWTALINEAGGTAIAYDKYPDGSRGFDAGSRPKTPPEWRSYEARFQEQYTTVHEADHTVVSEYPDHTLFLCWPSLNGQWAAECVRQYREAGGRTVVLVSEGRGGSTGTDELFDELRGEDSPWESVDGCRLWTYTITTDRLDVYQLPRTN